MAAWVCVFGGRQAGAPPFPSVPNWPAARWVTLGEAKENPRGDGDESAFRRGDIQTSYIVFRVSRGPKWAGGGGGNRLLQQT